MGRIKAKRNKRVRNPKYHGEIPKVEYKKVVRKSRAGVEYESYITVFPPNPQGMNHDAMRRIKSVLRKQGEKV